MIWETRESKMNVFGKVLVLASLATLVSGSPTPKKAGYGPGDQDWGWIEVRKGAHMFYWLHRARSPPKESTPLIIWLQGGPGASSSGYGNFAEVGTLHINGSLRKYSWTEEYDVVFIDNPVGTGYSYVNDLKLLTKDNAQIGKDLVVFLKMFSEVYGYDCVSPVHVFGESYGGKMGVEAIKQWESTGMSSGCLLKIKTMTLLDPWLSPIDSIMGWAPLLLNVGLIDERGHKKLTENALIIKKALDNEEYEKATTLWGEQMTKVYEETGNVDFYNYLTRLPPRKMNMTASPLEKLYRTYAEIDEDEEIDKLMNGPVKKALQVPDKIIHGGQSQEVFNALAGDITRGYPHTVEYLLNNTNVKIAVVNGQLDLTVDTCGTYSWVKNLKWKDSSVWTSAKRSPVVVNNFIEGYVTAANNLVFFWINRAGHMVKVPKDNPEMSYEMLKMITGSGR